MWRLERVLIDGFTIPVNYDDTREESFFSFAKLLRDCDFGAALEHPFIAPIVKPILKKNVKSYDKAEDLKFDLECAADLHMDEYDSNIPNDDFFRKLSVISTAVLFLRIFSQKAITGPSFDNKTLSQQVLDRQRGVVNEEHPLCRLTILGHPDVPQSKIEGTLAQDIIIQMSVDGEEAYALSPCLSYLYLARALLDMKPLFRNLCTTVMWRSRACFLHQRSLVGAETAPAPSLLRSSVRDYAVLLKSIGCLPTNFHLGIGEEDVEDFISLNVNASDRSLLDVWVTQGVNLPPITKLMVEGVKEDRNFAAELTLELAVRLAFLGRQRAFTAASQHACELAGFYFELTGAEGIRRKYQTRAFAQLVVRKFKSKEQKDQVLSERNEGIDSSESQLDSATGERRVEAPGYVEDARREEEKAKREALGLSNDDREVVDDTLEAIIDRAKIEKGVADVSLRDADFDTELLEGGVMLTGSAKEREGIQEALSVLEQSLLLCHCQAMLNMVSANDEVAVLQMSALVERMLRRPPPPPSAESGEVKTLTQSIVNGQVVVTDRNSLELTPLDGDEGRSSACANWLTYSAGLWFRCCSENNRLKTQDRAALQLSILADQYNDKTPSSKHRLRFLFSLNFPSLWELKREVAVRNRKLGAALTAFEQFKALELWEDVGECLVIAGRRNEALELLSGISEKISSAGLLCVIGDLKGEDVETYQKAWDVSKGSCARAKRSIARALFKKGDIEGACQAFADALNVNPLNFNAWFTRGNCEMKLGRMEQAFNAYSRCVAINDSDSDSWGNLVAIATQMNDWKKAYHLSDQAVKRGRENWRLWISRMSICKQVWDVQSAADSVRSLALIGCLNRVDVRLLNWISYAACNDNGDVTLMDGRPGQMAAKIVLNTLLSAVGKTNSGAPSLPPKPAANQASVSGGLRTFDVALVDIWGVIGDIAASKGVQDVMQAVNAKEKEWRLLQQHFDASVGTLGMVTVKDETTGKDVIRLNRIPALTVALKICSCGATLGYLLKVMMMSRAISNSKAVVDLSSLSKELKRLAGKIIIGSTAGVNPRDENYEEIVAKGEAEMHGEEKERMNVLKAKVQSAVNLIEEAIRFCEQNGGLIAEEEEEEVQEE
eukprot:GDKJ01023646.1.p1 GENE.GDKJ01023646.1~~GDKJ01023646.1.p1  ORF type:complete len:1120 (-),score=309.01 GDKJ01023646.1:195-3554(-)